MTTATLTRHNPAAATLSHWVDAPPFRALVCQLVSDSGLPWRVLARASGVPSATVYGLLRGRDGRPVRQLRKIDADRLMRMSAQQLTDLSHEPASPEAMRALVRALNAAGCPPQAIARFVRLDTGSVHALLADGMVWCSRLQLLHAEAACEARGLQLSELLAA